MIRALIVDDSPTARALIAQILDGDPGVEVIGEAADGVAAVEQTARLRPDVIVMDLQMPRLDGIGATRRIMQSTPTPIVITSGIVDVREVVVSMNALTAGALALIAKPGGPTTENHVAEARHFLATVKAMSQVKLIWRQRAGQVRARRTTGEPPPTRPLRPLSARPVNLVAIAASTGGPAALHRILGGLPAEFAAPIVIVQHMAVGFSEGFVKWLGTAGRVPVELARDGALLAAGTAYVCPDGVHLEMAGRGLVALSDAPPVGGFRPSGTVLFEAAAKVYGSEMIGVILSGMGRDGVDGLRAVRQAGGRVLAQDEATSAVFGMPREAIEEGLADDVVAVDQIAERLIAAVALGRGA